MTPETRLAEFLDAALPAQVREGIGVAVSGGGDSTALMHLVAGWVGDAPGRVEIATVDHGLRPEAAAEAAGVAMAAGRLGLAHETLRWRGWDGQGNLQDAARRARYRLLADWARRRGLAAVLLGHTRDDDVECLLLGLARGAGLDGLSGMRPAFRRDGARFLRPLLGVGRDELRGWLRARGLDWIDDPSNEDARFARVRVREALDVLAPLGVDRDALARSVSNLRRTRAMLDARLRDFVLDHCRTPAGDVVLARDSFDALPDEMARRFLRAALRWVSGGDHAPRAAKLSRLLADRALLGAGATLHGCVIRDISGALRIGREPEAAARARPAGPGETWDGRWRVSGPFEAGMVVRCLGTGGLALRPGWRSARLPRATCLSGPAVWRGSELVAAPLIEPDGVFAARSVEPFADSL